MPESSTRILPAIREIWHHQLFSFSTKVDDRVEMIGISVGGLVVAVSVVFFGYLIARRILARIQRTLVRRGHLLESQASTLRAWAMVVIAPSLLAAALSMLHIPITAFAFLGGALAIGLGFGSQTLIKNFISGIILLAERKIQVGDIIEVDGLMGTVTEINTRASVIRNFDDVETLIPNSILLENRVTNRMLSDSLMRFSIVVGVAYRSDPQQVIGILENCASRNDVICKQPAPFAILEDFAESALTFRLYYWIDLSGPGNGLIAASDIRSMIAKNFTEAGIEIPFPQRNLHLTGYMPQIQPTTANSQAQEPDVV